MTLRSKLFILASLCMTLTNCKTQSQKQPEKESESEVKAMPQDLFTTFGTAVTTLVDDATQMVGNGVYRMGVRNPGIHGIACRKYSQQAGVNFDSGKAFVFYVAPSDALFKKVCARNPYGGEPSCAEIADECGKRIEITCNDPVHCTQPGEKSLFSKMYAEGFRDAKNQNSIDSMNDLANILLTKYQSKFPNKAALANVKTPKSIVLVINDFCPQLHSANAGNCAGPHLDVSNAAYLLYGKANAQGYISPNVNVNFKFHNSKTVEIGPRW